MTVVAGVAVGVAHDHEFAVAALIARGYDGALADGPNRTAIARREIRAVVRSRGPKNRMKPSPRESGTHPREPQRRRISQVLYRTLGPLFGANRVSLHDAHVSIAAGFRGDELARSLGLGAPDWEIHCSTTLLGMHRLIAVRRA